MKTKQIPAVIMLVAGFMTSIAGVVNHMETVQFLKTLIIVLVIFYVLGCVVKLILDKNFKEEVKEVAMDKAVEEEAVKEFQGESSQEE